MSNALAHVPSSEVLEFNHGVRAYAPTSPRAYWRIRWQESGQRRETTAPSREVAIAKAAALVTRLDRAVPTDRRRATGADIVAHYLDPSREPPKTPAWSLRHREEQTRYCERFVLPVLGHLRCDRITSSDLRRVLELAATASVAEHLRRCLTALVAAAHEGGYLLPAQDVLHGVVLSRRDKPDRADRAIAADEVPNASLVHELAAMAGRQSEWWRELEILLVAYSGLRFGEHAALMRQWVDVPTGRVTVAQQVIESQKGTQVVTLPKGRRHRVTVFPHVTPEGVELSTMVERRLSELDASDALVFPAPRGGWERRSNYRRNTWDPAAISAGWPRRADGRWQWTFHSLRHVFATWALGLSDVTIEDVSRFMGHSSPRVTQEVYLHFTTAAFDRFHRGVAIAAARGA